MILTDCSTSLGLQKTTGVKVPTLLELHTSRTRKCAEKIITEPSHPDHQATEKLLSTCHHTREQLKDYNAHYNPYSGHFSNVVQVA
ncbi:hypothetical protein NFI96_034256 [Prochilodus magdalenae]|nr:hypothetical protein NFI96_034256 [Prochilodus magdalenae]